MTPSKNLPPHTTHTTHTEECDCPVCGALLNAASPLEGDFSPEPGDVSICFSCGTLLKFDDDMLMVELLKTEYDEMPREQQIELAKMQILIQRKNATLQ